MELPTNLKYTESHEWVRSEADGMLAVGITDHAQEALGDLVFIELPQIGRKVEAGEVVGVVESVKAASDIYAPVAGEGHRGPGACQCRCLWELALQAQTGQRGRHRQAARRQRVREDRRRRIGKLR